MKRLMILFLMISCVTLFSCKREVEEEKDNSGEMYRNYKVSEDVLKSANLPIVYVQTENNTKILDKENWINATFSISNKDEWNMDETEITIKGRGNSTWGQPKRPYAIKFSKKQSVCGMPKGKRWVLIANYMDNSFMKNYMAFYMAEKIGMEYTVRGEFVNLVLNGNYVGLYWLGEAIKVDKNRVNIDEENEYLIEMDISYDETWRFHSAYKKLPYMVKNDDFMTDEKLEYLKNHVAEMESVLYDESSTLADIEKYVDLNSFAQFYVVNEIMANRELKHPKSCYFTLKSDEILRASTVWDFDWAGYNPSHNFLDKTIYYDTLFKYPTFRNKVNMYTSMLSSADFVKEIDSLKEYINPSVKLDKDRWGKRNNPVGEKRNNFDEYVEYFKDCITDRLDFMQANPF
jgi:hypothetical protein